MKRQVSLEEISDGRLYEANDMVKADCGDCKGCSACCRGMGESIILDPMDIYRITGGLSVPFQSLLAGYAELHVVDGIILPNLNMSGEKAQCAFLNEEGRCSIHAFRPGICRLFPLGRYYEEQGFRYFLQIKECPKENKSKVKVKKWVDTPDLKRYEQYVKDWHFLQKALQKQITEAVAPEETEKEVNMELLNLFYIKPYQTEEDFYGQFYERIAEFSHNAIFFEFKERQYKFDNLQQEF